MPANDQRARKRRRSRLRESSVVVQIALDFVDLPRAVEVAREAVARRRLGEAGTPLIKAEGLQAVRSSRRLPDT